MKPTELKGHDLVLRNAGARRSVGATFRLDIFLFDQAGTERHLRFPRRPSLSSSTSYEPLFLVGINARLVS